MDFSGQQAPLTWVRTPLHDRDYLRSRINSNPEPICNDVKNPEYRRAISLGSNLSHERFQHFTRRILRKKRKISQRLFTTPDYNRRPSVPKKKDKEQWKVVHFVVGGQMFKSPEWIFQSHPQTLLGNLEKRKEFYYAKQKSYVFPEVLPDVFASVLEYYQTGVLGRPERLTLNYFLEHVEVFALEPEAIDALLAIEGVYRSEPEAKSITDSTCLSQMWNFLDVPWSSKTARIYSFISLLVTIFSVILYIVETLPDMRIYSLIGKTTVAAIFQSPFTIINTICFVFFSIEFILRVISCPSKIQFARDWTNWADLFSIIPFVISLILFGIYSDSRHAMTVSVLNILRGCRLLMITRVLGTVRYYRQHWITILAQTLWNNIQTLFILFFLLIISMVAFGGLIYAVEGVGDVNPTFTSIPLGMWWAVITSVILSRLLFWLQHSKERRNFHDNGLA